MLLLSVTDEKLIINKFRTGEKMFIENKNLKVSITEYGAEMKSIQCEGKEYLWPGKEGSFNYSAPILFPICGALRDDRFIKDGIAYNLGKHGYAKYKKFETESKDAESACFLHKPDEEDKKHFPYEYEFRVRYILSGKSVSVSYETKNLSAENMYFSVGAHEAYLCPDGIDGYSVRFEKKETAESYLTEGSLLNYKSLPFLKDEDTIRLKDDYFKNDALVFKGLKSQIAVLEGGGRALQLDFADFGYFLIWMIPGEEFVCLEPWCGMPDKVDGDYSLSSREGILCAKPGETVIKTHKITVIK